MNFRIPLNDIHAADIHSKCTADFHNFTSDASYTDDEKIFTGAFSACQAVAIEVRKLTYLLRKLPHKCHHQENGMFGNCACGIFFQITARKLCVNDL